VPHNNKPTGGGIQIEWALLAAAISAGAIGVAQYGSHSVSDYYAGQVRKISDAFSDQPSQGIQLAEDGCFHGTDKNDSVTATEQTSCYKLHGGDDDFDGTAAAVPLVVDAGAGQGALTSVTTGSGADRITSGQSGTIHAGPGDDIIDLALPYAGRFEVSPGPGEDRVTLAVQDPPSGAAPNKLASGTGSLVAELACANTPVDFTMLPGSSSELYGDCPINARTVGAEGERRLTARLSSFAARFDAAEQLFLDITPFDTTPSSDPQGLYIPNWISGRISYVAHSVSQADLTLASSSPVSSGMVEATLYAPHGTISLDGTGHSAWTIDARYTDGGHISLSFPDEDRFVQMQSPQLSGQAEVLRISGCFDEIALGRGHDILWSTDGCRSEAAETFFVDPNQADLTLKLSRGGDHQSISLGAGDLQIKQITVSR
jgi:hypothetical protein